MIRKFADWKWHFFIMAYVSCLQSRDGGDWWFFESIKSYSKRNGTFMLFLEYVSWSKNGDGC
jgi:hypothetical protein